MLLRHDNTLENGTLSLLLATGTIPAVGADIDADDDGLGFKIVDAIAVNDGGAADKTYGGVTLGVAYDGLAFAPGGASRLPDGTDTAADWVRNDFDLADIPGFTGTLTDGEAVNTPGAANTTTPEPTGPGEGEAGCELETVTIGSIQGADATTPVPGTTVRVEGVVVGDFQTGGFNGYYVQDAGDGDPATSDAVFVYAPGGDAVDGALTVASFNCNGVHTQAAAALADWLATDPTGQGAGRALVLGDLNSYAQENPMQVLYGAGYTDVVAAKQGEGAYTYVFDGQLGSLDHALAGSAIVGEVTDAAVWNVNADEPSLIDYDMTFTLPAQDALYTPDAYRSSDHDPVVIGLDLRKPDRTKPTATIKEGASFTVPTGDTFDLISFKLYDAGKIDKVTLNGVVKNLTDNTWSDVNFIKPGVFGGVKGLNTLVVYDVAGNTQTYTVTLN